MILLRLRESALLRQGLLSEPEASSAPVSMFLADFRTYAVSADGALPVPLPHPRRTVHSIHHTSIHYTKKKDGHPKKRDSRPFLTHHT